MIKGRTKIELTDVNTGQRQEIVHDNMVTNGFLKFVNNLGGLCGSLDSLQKCFDPTDVLLKDMYGGVMLFDKPLNEDADDLWIPSDTRCVAYGSDVANSGVNTHLGSFNVTESGEMSDGSYRFVWDFATNQGNGNIASLGLVPKNIAKAGWNNKRGEVDTAIHDRTSYTLHTTSISPSDMLTDIYLFYDDEYIYGIERGNLKYNSSKPGNYVVGTRTLRITKQLYPHRKISIFNKIRYPTNKIVEVIEVPLPSNISALLDSVKNNVLYKHIEYDNGYIYAFFSSDGKISANAKMLLLKINVEDWSTSVVEVTNTTNLNLQYLGASDSGHYLATSDTELRIVNGYLIVRGGSGNIYIINLANNMDVKRATYYDETVFSSTYFYSGFKYKDYLFFATYSDNYNYDKAFVLNIKTGEVFVFYKDYGTNALILFNNSNHVVKNRYNEDFYHITVKYDGSLFTHMNPLVLMTKNNLDNVVTKTSAQTMKVTYILSES